MPTTRGLRLTPLSVCSHPLQDGNTPLHRAVFFRELDFAEMLLKCKVDLQDGCAPLHDAARVKDPLASAEVLLRHKADVNAQNEVGEAWWCARSLRCGFTVASG